MLFFTTVCSGTEGIVVSVFFTMFLDFVEDLLLVGVFVLSTTVGMSSVVLTFLTLIIRSIRSRMGPESFWR